MHSLLVVEDEPNLANGLAFNLKLEGYAADIAADAEQALPTFSRYDLIILDLMLPAMSGLELLRQIRERDHKKPVLILSAKSAEEDLVAGLSAGADDYVTKPFSLPELLLRIQRILERSSWTAAGQPTARYEFDGFWLDCAALEAMTTNGVVALTPYECFLMKYLIENRQRAVSREEILREVWGYEHLPETRTVDIFIARLRKLFEPDTRIPRHIKSVRGVGYRFFER
jgi:two-component system, OmpR family, alkaline phosphatase synthesis response regulator PhoP